MKRGSAVRLLLAMVALAMHSGASMRASGDVPATVVIRSASSAIPDASKPASLPRPPTLTAPQGPARISVRVLSRLRPRALELSGPRRVSLRARGDTLLVDGVPVAQPLELRSGEWTARVPGALPRHYRAGLSVRAGSGHLQVVADFDFDRYLIEVTSSETERDTPPAALQAQAVVARSYALSAGRRHPDADACDMAHCQVLYGDGTPRHRTAAAAAVAATRGQVLRLESGHVALAPFHAACAGHTADPVEVFGGEDRSGAAAVPDPGCPSRPWKLRLNVARVERAAWEAFGVLDRAGNGARPAWSDLALEHGRGGYLVRLVDRRSGLVTAGDRFVRALAASAGWDRVRGNRLELVRAGSSVELSGNGIGHGVGLCQAGASRLAHEGWRYDAILRRYFPRATLSGSSS